MDNNTLIIIAVVAIAGIVLGAIIGYLLGGKKDTGIEADKAAAEARANELDKQVKQKDIEISRRDDQIQRNQQMLVAAEGAKTEAETKLVEANADIYDLREQLDAKELERQSIRDKNINAEKIAVQLNEQNKSILRQLEDQKQFLADAEEKLREAFSSLSSEALRRNNVTFLESAKETLTAKVKESELDLDARKLAIETLVKPLSESLQKFDGKLGEIELKREGAYEGMKTLLGAMQNATENLNTGTNQLVSALKTSHVRGKYGEISLVRVVEAAGLSPHCDYDVQTTVSTESGNLRPDMNINLPGHRQLILDSKVPLISYMRAFETDNEEERIGHFKDHAVAVRTHLKQLSHKSYWEQFKQAPDFVIMYLQVESSFGAALMADPTLIEDAINKQIVIATPSTLITMLRTVGFMWQQEKMAEQIIEMRDAGVELYKRANTMLGHFNKIGSSLNSAVTNYNNAVGSMESRVVTQLEKIKMVGGTLAKDDLNTVKHIETAIKPVTKELGGYEDDEL